MGVVFCAIGQFRPVRLDCMTHSADFCPESSGERSSRRVRPSLDISRKKGLGMKGLYAPREMTLMEVRQIDYAVKGRVKNGTEERLEKNYSENGTLDAA